MNCSTPTDQANGQVSHTAGTTFGQTAIYSCDTGYNLVGESTRTCQATGAWSGNEPICQGMHTMYWNMYTQTSCNKITQPIISKMMLVSSLTSL